MTLQVENNPTVILVTGPSGAGRTTAINALEDAGFEAIDNMPLTLIPKLLEGPALDQSIVLGVDTRNRDFSIAQLIETIDGLGRNPSYNLQVLYLDCSIDELARRFSITRRRHPMSPDGPPVVGIRREFDLLTPIQARADVLIDTTELSPHDLRADVERWFAPNPEGRMAITVHSFSYKRGVPRGLDIMFDCRFLRNPHWDPVLQPMNGRDAAVQKYVTEDERFVPFLAHVQSLTKLVLPAHVEEGRAHLSIGFGCSGGQHRSVTMAEMLSKALENAEWHVSIRHRELERQGKTSQPGTQEKRSA